MLTIILIGAIELGCINALYRYDILLRRREFRDALRGQLTAQLQAWVDVQGSKAH